MTTRTTDELSKTLVVACDQVYFSAAHPVSVGQTLGPLDDKDPRG